MQKFPRSLRLDSSDLRVFDRAAEPGEWAVPGTFAFSERPKAELEGKARQAFRSGWLGTESFGRSTLAQIAEISEAEFFQVVERLARHFVAHYGAPDLAAALPAARAEADYAAGLCAAKLHTLLVLQREWGNDGIHERVRIVTPSRAQGHARIWDIVPDEAGESDTGSA